MPMLKSLHYMQPIGRSSNVELIQIPNYTMIIRRNTLAKLKIMIIRPPQVENTSASLMVYTSASSYILATYQNLPDSEDSLSSPESSSAQQKNFS